MEFVFFKCNELDKQPERIREILLDGENIYDNNDDFWGIGEDCKKYRLNHSNITNNNCSFSLVDPNKPLTSKKWKQIKQTRKIKRDTPQNEGILNDLNITPFRAIYKNPKPSRKMLWVHKPTISTSRCDFFALMIDSSVNKLAGIAKAIINRPGSSSYEIPQGSTILPDTIDYIYISEVDLHPSYIGKGLCKPLVKFLMNKIAEISPSYKYFSIDNASINDEGIPACVCYVKSGTENGYDVYYSEYKSNIVNKMTPELCYISDDKTQFKMPDVYYYVKKSTRGGKFKKTRKRKNKKNKKN